MRALATFQLGMTISLTGWPSWVVTTMRLPSRAASKAILTNPKPSRTSSVIERFVSFERITNSECALSDRMKLTLLTRVEAIVAT